VGQTNFNPAKDKFSTISWGSEKIPARFYTSWKLGYVFQRPPFKFRLSNSLQYSLNRILFLVLMNYDMIMKGFIPTLLFNSINRAIPKANLKRVLHLLIDGYGEMVNRADYSRVD